MTKKTNGRVKEFKIQYGKDKSVVAFRKDSKLIALKSNAGKLLKRSYSEAVEVESIDDFTIFEVPDGKILESTLDLARLNSDVAIGTHLYHMMGDGACCLPNGEIYLKLNKFGNDKLYEQIFEEFELEIVEVRSEKELIVRVTKGSDNPIKVVTALQKKKEIEIAEPELLNTGQLCNFSLPEDDLLDQQWHLKNTGKLNGTSWMLKKGADARVVAAWERSRSLGSSDVVVAVIDDGFDLDHPDIGGANKIHAPFDFQRNLPNPTPNSLMKDNHGTACAGVAIGNANGEGIVGAAPNARLMPIRMGATLSDREIEKWFDYVCENGAWVVSCSWKASARKFKLSTRKHDAIARCARKGHNGNGVVICFAAGNDNQDIDDSSTLNGFATHPDVIAVGASNSRDKRSSYSNFGSKSLWVCAPSNGAGGWGILTADVTGTYVDQKGVRRSRGYVPGAYYRNFGGTSSACPLVAGICALALSIKPCLTATELKDLIKKTARQIEGGHNKKGYSPMFGYGCIDALALVKALI